MAFYREDIVSIELESGSIHRSFLNHSIGSGDIQANRFGVRVVRNGEDVDLTGVSCFGYFRNAEGTDIALTNHGTVDGNVAFVTLPQACYNVEGQFTLAIKLVGGGVTGTMRIIDGTVDNTNTESPVAPTEDVPTYTEILAVFDQMQEAVEDYSETVSEQNTKIENMEADVSAMQNDVQLSRAEVMVNVPNMVDGATWTDGAYIAEDGTITQSEPMHYSSLIELTSNQVEYTLCFVPKGENRTMRIHGYDEDGNWIKQLVGVHSSRLTPGVPAYGSFVGSDCKYCRISISKEYTAVYLGQTIDDKAVRAQLLAYINSCGATGETNLLDSVEWTEFAGIGSGGEIITDSGFQYNHYSDLIPVLQNKRYRVAWICKANRTGGGTYIDGYDENGDWVKRLRIFPMAEENIGVPNVGYFNSESCPYIRITTRSYNFTALSKCDDFEETVTESMYTKTTVPFEDGGLNFLNGSNTTTAGRIRTTTWANLAAEFIRGENVQFTLFVYDRDATFLGVWNGTKLVTGSVTWFDFLNVREVYNALSDHPNLLFKLTARRPGYDAITPVSGAKVHFYTKIIPYTSVGCFLTWAVCGASSDAGFFDGSNHQNYAWGKILSRMVGNTEYNYATAGQKLTDFLNNQGTTGMKQLLEDPAHELYVITLGGNDASDSSITIGTITDISNHSDWHDYENTMYGNYGRIVSQIMEHAPDAKIILTTPPGISYNARHLATDNMIREIAAYYGVPYVEWESDEFMRSDVYTKNQVGSHPTKPLYAGKAMAFERLFSRCYAENPGYFA